jgi:hypothetical protein
VGDVAVNKFHLEGMEVVGIGHLVGMLYDEVRIGI